MGRIDDILMTGGGMQGGFSVPGTNEATAGPQGPANGSMPESAGALGMRTPFDGIAVPQSAEETPGEVIRTTVNRFDVEGAPGSAKPDFMDVRGSGTVAGGFGGKGGIR